MQMAMRQLSAMKNPLPLEKNVSLASCNTFGIAAHADYLLRIRHADQLSDIAGQIARADAAFANGWLAWGGGSNIVLASEHVRPAILKMENQGIALVDETHDHWIVQAAAGERWHDLVTWTLEQGFGGLENLALIPGSVGAAPVQNIGAYGLELKDRFHSLDAVDMRNGQTLTLNAAQCRFGYRDSVFKHAPSSPDDAGLAGRAVITRVRLALPKAWQPHLHYSDLQRKMHETGMRAPSAQQICDMVLAIRRAKLPDPTATGNAGSFFKNPVISAQQCADILAREPLTAHYPLPDGSVKLAAGWLIEACGWRGKHMGNAGVYPNQALVLVNRYAETGIRATGAEVLQLARAIQESVRQRFGIQLEMEPMVV